MTAPDFEISTRLRADSLTAHVPPDVRTAVEGDDVTLARDQTRRGLPAQIETAAQYRNVLIEKRLLGEKHGRSDGEGQLRTATAKNAALSRGRSSEVSTASRQAKRADREPTEGEPDDMSNDMSAAERRRVQRERRRHTLVDNRPRVDEVSAHDGTGGSPADSRRRTSIRELVGSSLTSISVPTALGLGAVIGAAAGAGTAAKMASRQEDVISGAVKIDLLKKVELLTIKLRIRRGSDDRPPR
ncbi:MAG TPA: hypothetical protein VGJ58_07755 [Gaiellaceae bacterium]